jgi:carboxymethylenebutenolidase
MLEKKVEARTPDGIADCEYFAASESGQWPGVIMYTDVLGIRDVFRTMARRLVDDGYSVLLPNLYYRVAKDPVFSFKPAFGEEKTVARIAELRPSAASDLVSRDVGAYVETLLAQPQTKGPKAGAVGYCMGGGIAMRTAAALPEKVGAAASFHGSRLYSDDADSPHLLLPMIKGKLYFGFAVEDKTMPPEAIAGLKQALSSNANAWDDDIYEGAKHGWCVADHNVYNHAQAERAWEHMLRLFRSTIG